MLLCIYRSRCISVRDSCNKSRRTVFQCQRIRPHTSVFKAREEYRIPENTVAWEPGAESCTCSFRTIPEEDPLDTNVLNMLSWAYLKRTLSFYKSISKTTTRRNKQADRQKTNNPPPQKKTQQKTNQANNKQAHNQSINQSVSQSSKQASNQATNQNKLANKQDK